MAKNISVDSRHGIDCKSQKWGFGFPVALVALASVVLLYIGGNLLFKYALITLIFVAILFNVILNVNSPLRLDFSSGKKRLSLLLLFAALLGFMASTLHSLVLRDLLVQDYGVFFVQAILPLFLIITSNRRLFIEYIGRVCVLFALIDALLNLLAVLGYIDISMSGRLVGDEVRLRYTGLSGNSHAAGFVAFVASLYLTFKAHQLRRWIGLIGLLVGMLLVSLYFIDARRYMVFSVVGIMVLLGWKYSSRIGLVWLMSALSVLFLGATFLTAEMELGNALRAALLLKGLEDASKSSILGSGPMYLDLSMVEPVEEELIGAGVTESQLLDLAKSYGIAATLLFLSAVLLALSRRRHTLHPYELTLITLLTSELFFGGAIRGVLGSLLFFACLLVSLERKLQ